METHLQFQMLSLRDEEDKNQTTEGGTMNDHHHHPHQTQQLNPSPSSSSSPSHEFSFNVSLDQSSMTLKIPEKNSSLLAVDLSPADEIFLHGHLLPLDRFFTHTPVSPRSSTDSLDQCFTLPIDTTTTTSSTSDECHHLQDKITNTPLSEQRQGRNVRAKSKSKSKSFLMLFSLSRLKRKELRHDREKESRARKRKLKLDVIKRYVRLVKPFLVSLRSRKRVDHCHHRIDRSTCSFSGNLQTTREKGFGDWSREYISAPASMIHSPTTYSGILVASGSVTPTYYNNSASTSTVEDLQEAIQAAIAHCKKSNASTLQPSVLSI